MDFLFLLYCISVKNLALCDIHVWQAVLFFHQTFFQLQDDPEDLSFKKGDILEVIRKDEEEWWFAKHEDGRQGSIPVPYVQIVSVYRSIMYSSIWTFLWNSQ